MSMYLPNPDLHGGGFEPAEFIDVPLMAEVAGEPHGSVERSAPNIGGRLDPETQRALARRAEEYISGLVESCDGSLQDVRAVIDGLRANRGHTHDRGAS